MKLFCKTKNKKEIRNNDNNIYHLFLTSIIGISFCIICLCGTTYAWFTSTVSTNINTIKSATYSVTVTEPQSSDDIKIEKDGNNTKLTFNNTGTYSITIAPDQNNNVSKGYCIVNYKNTNYYTENLTSDSFTFIVNATENEVLTITPNWGTYPSTSEIKDASNINSIFSASNGGESNQNLLTQNNENANDANEIKLDNQVVLADSSVDKTNENGTYGIKDTENIDGKPVVANNETTENSSSDDSNIAQSDLVDTFVPTDTLPNDEDLSFDLDIDTKESDKQIENMPNENNELEEGNGVSTTNSGE